MRSIGGGEGPLAPSQPVPTPIPFHWRSWALSSPAKTVEDVKMTILPESLLLL